MTQPKHIKVIAIDGQVKTYAQSIRLSYGVLSAKISTQLKNQGFKFDVKKIKKFEREVDAINTLRFNSSLLTDSIADKLFEKLHKKIVSHVTEINISSVTSEYHRKQQPVSEEPEETTGAELILAKRLKHPTKHGYSADHDRKHSPIEFINAAKAYMYNDIHSWPWEGGSFKLDTQIENLVNAGSMIAAAIDLLKLDSAQSTEKEIECPETAEEAAEKYANTGSPKSELNWLYEKEAFIAGVNWCKKQQEGK